MSSTVVSKNLYELLGNDHDQDSDKEPEPPVKVVDKTPARTDKRSAPREAPAAPVGGSKRTGPGGNEGAFRDRNAGRSANEGKPTEERRQGTYSGRGRGEGRGRGGRGRGGADRGDRHQRSAAHANSDKQAAHGWGAEDSAKAELADEQGAEAIAKADEKVAIAEDGTDAPVNAEGQTIEEEEQDNSISYADYLIQQAEKKAALKADAPAARKANEGTKEDKKWASAKALIQTEQEDFVAGGQAKAKRERERKAKNVLDIDQRFVEAAPERGAREGGRGRGGRGRGEGRGGRGDGFRGGRGRGDGPRGGAPRGGAPRGAPRGGASIAIEDTNAFPSLGA